MKLSFFNCATIIGIFFILVQQLIVASSTAIIAQLSQSILSGAGYLLWLVLFVISLTIVYIPTMLTNHFINKAKYFTYKDYISKFSKQAYNHPNKFFDSNFRKEKEAYFTHEAWLIIQEDYNFIVDIVGIVLNVVLNVLVLSIYLDWFFLFSYILAVPLTFACATASKTRLLKKSDKLQKSRNEMLQTLSYGWDTILLGNKWNVSLWKNKFEKRSDSADIHQRRLSLEIDVMSTITLFVSAFPILMVLFMSFFNAKDDIQKLAMLVATAPRQVLTIQYLSEIINLFVNLNDKVRRTKQLSANLVFDKDTSTLDSRIIWGSVFIKSPETKTAIHCFDNIIKATNNFEKGRFTITGDNGTGKTTLLANIKSKMGDKAYILPSQSRIAFQNDDQERGFSTGEKLRENFKEISLNVCDGSCSVLLLDEWNANLDKENIDSINTDIDKISKDICIIEVLHLPASTMCANLSGR